MPILGVAQCWAGSYYMLMGAHIEIDCTTLVRDVHACWCVDGVFLCDGTGKAGKLKFYNIALSQRWLHYMAVRRKGHQYCSTNMYT